MSTRLQTLRDDGIHAVFLQPQCLFNCGGGREHLGAPSADTRQQLRRRQSEVKADYRRAKRRQYVGELCAERSATSAVGNRVGIDVVFSVVWRERRAPGLFTRLIGYRRLMSEKINTPGAAVGLFVHHSQFSAQSIRAQSRSRQ